MRPQGATNAESRRSSSLAAPDLPIRDYLPGLVVPQRYGASVRQPAATLTHDTHNSATDMCD